MKYHECSECGLVFQLEGWSHRDEDLNLIANCPKCGNTEEVRL